MSALKNPKMAPPTFGDLGKQARDVFGKGYNFGVVKLDCKTKSEAGVEIKSGGTHVLEAGKVNGNLETKLKCADYGVTLTEGWSTDNVLTTEVSMEDKPSKGLKLVLNTKFAPATGKLNGTIKSTYKTDALSVNLDSTLDPSGPLLTGAGVASYRNWLLGGQVGFDSAKSKLTKTNFAVGFAGPDFNLHTFCNDGAEYGGSLHQKVNKEVEAAVDVGYSSSSNVTRFGLGCKVKLDASSSVHAKVNNTSQIGLGYQHKLRDGVTITLSTLLDAKNFSAGGHKLGLALEFDA